VEVSLSKAGCNPGEYLVLFFFHIGALPKNQSHFSTRILSDTYVTFDSTQIMKSPILTHLPKTLLPKLQSLPALQNKSLITDVYKCPAFAQILFGDSDGEASIRFAGFTPGVGLDVGPETTAEAGTTTGWQSQSTSGVWRTGCDPNGEAVFTPLCVVKTPKSRKPWRGIRPGGAASEEGALEGYKTAQMQEKSGSLQKEKIHMVDEMRFNNIMLPSQVCISPAPMHHSMLFRHSQTYSILAPAPPRRRFSSIIRSRTSP